MEILDLMKKRHSVRQYLDQKIPEEVRQELEQYTEALNQESGLHIQILYDEPDCFNSFLAHYGHFKNVKNYLALVGKKSFTNLDELCGYYGQKIVLTAQTLGLNTLKTGIVTASTNTRPTRHSSPPSLLTTLPSLHAKSSMQRTKSSW